MNDEFDKKNISNTKNIFCGFSPVITPQSQVYWANHNGVIFPKDFSLNLQSHIDFVQLAIRSILGLDDNIYLMPIRLDPVIYTKNVLNFN